MPENSFDARADLDVGGETYEIFRLDALQSKFDVARLPFSLKVLLENLLRNEDGVAVTKEHIEKLASWDAAAEPSEEIAFTPARVLMQDFTGVPAVVDLAAMRDALAAPGRDAIDADAERPEFERELPHDLLERGLGGAHDVVIRNRTLGREVGQGDHARVPALHERRRVAGERQQGEGAGLEGDAEALAIGGAEVALEVFAPGVRDAVGERVEPAHLGLDGREAGVELGLVVHVERQQQRVDEGRLLRQLLERAPEAIALVGEREAGSAGGELARDAPRDGAVVRHSEHDRVLASPIECVQGGPPDQAGLETGADGP
jgi:hypothetical protein